jgi:hypothetical protein
MNRQRRFEPSSRFDDATGQAGWMYTDLILGLMVVFLATISFLPQSLPGSNTSAYVYTQNFDQIFEKVYSADSPNAALLDSDISKFLATNQLPESTFVEVVQIVGGFDPATESITAGIGRAVSFGAAIDNKDSGILGDASTTVDANAALGKNGILIRLKFGAQVK